MDNSNSSDVRSVGLRGATRWILRVCPFFLGLYGFMLVFDEAFWIGSGANRADAAVAGTVERQIGGVRHRSDGSMMWRDLSQEKLAVKAGDSVFTSSNGRAEISLDQGVHAKVLPNSLIVITSQSPVADSGAPQSTARGRKGEATLNIQKGNIKLDITDGSKSVRVAVQGKTYVISSQAAPQRESQASSVEIQVDPEAKDGEAIKFSSDAGSGDLVIRTEAVSGDGASPSAPPEEIVLKGGQEVAMQQNIEAALETPAEVVPPKQPEIEVANSPESRESDVSRKPAQQETSPVASVPEVTSAPVAALSDTLSAGPEQAAFKRYSLLDLSLSFSFFKIDAVDVATGDSAILLSDQNYGMRLRWKQALSRAWNTFLGVRAEKVAVPDLSTRTIQGGSQTLSGFQAGLEWFPGSTHEDSGPLLLSIHYETFKRLFARGLSRTVVVLDALAMSSGHVRLGYRFLKLDPFEFDLNLGGRWLLGGSHSSYTISSGNGLSGTLGVRQQLSGWSIQGAVFYDRSTQNTSIVNLSQTELGVSGGISLTLGK